MPPSFPDLVDITDLVTSESDTSDDDTRSTNFVDLVDLSNPPPPPDHLNLITTPIKGEIASRFSVKQMLNQRIKEQNQLLGMLQRNSTAKQSPAQQQSVSLLGWYSKYTPHTRID